MLNASHPGEYKVTNLGHCGITAPGYPGTSQYSGLMSGSWDIVVVMLGTNDAKMGKNLTRYAWNTHYNIAMARCVDGFFGRWGI